MVPWLAATNAALVGAGDHPRRPVGYIVLTGRPVGQIGACRRSDRDRRRADDVSAVQQHCDVQPGRRLRPWNACDQFAAADSRPQQRAGVTPAHRAQSAFASRVRRHAVTPAAGRHSIWISAFAVEPSITISCVSPRRRSRRSRSRAGPRAVRYPPPTIAGRCAGQTAYWHLERWISQPRWWVSYGQPRFRRGCIARCNPRPTGSVARGGTMARTIGWIGSHGTRAPYGGSHLNWR